ncbi:hypothetical protein NC651_003294 [Populus alba x Populus x berolinensis]|nr:hypothetical protein NC651_003294 [Populus alba x Populus x berolinensis]
MGAQDDHDQSRALSQLCSMIVEILKSPSWPPWFCFFHFAAIVSHLSEFGKSIFCPVPRHHVPGKKAEPSFAILLFVEL